MLNKEKNNTQNIQLIDFKGLGDPKINEILKTVSPKYKNDAYSLLSFIHDKNIMKWNSRNELLQQNVPITNSNIQKLIIHAVSKKSKKPKGYLFFYNKLKEFKVPHYLLKNNLKKYTSHKETFQWRPPGELYKSQ